MQMCIHGYNCTQGRFQSCKRSGRWLRQCRLQLLLPEEKDLCSKLHLSPKSYLCIKDALLREALKNEGKLRKKQIRDIARLEAGGTTGPKAGKILELLVEMGWLQNGNR